MAIDVHDDRECYCRMLGHDVPFKYCRLVQEGLPCGNVLNCWHEKFEVKSYLQDHFTTEQIEIILTPPKAKMASIVELIEQAKKAGKQSESS